MWFCGRCFDCKGGGAKESVRGGKGGLGEAKGWVCEDWKDV